ncbi:hypothetical protein [Paraburkholderia heleia]|uniref:hypothetical protein n=1 Tax=Paraburkholderia heleia TaxID=634127 RepID=UPI002AB71C32|nr:hypothetical protein [Paraburkholderia heleia]
MKTEDSKKKTTGIDSLYIGVLLAICAVVAGYVVLSTLVWQSRNLIPVPWYDDMYDHVRMHNAMTDFRTFMAYMISPHNEHRIFTTRLVSLIDERFFTGREFGQVLTTNLLQILGGVVSWVVFLRSGLFENRYVRLSLLSLILLFFINPNFLYTLFVPFQLQFAVMTFICVVTAFVMSNASAKEGAEPAKLIAALLALAFVGTFTLGNSPIVFIAAAATSIVLRWRRSTTVTLVVLAIIHTAIMLAITQTTGERSHSLLEILKFSLMYIGGPFIRADPWPGNFVTWGDSPHTATVCGIILFAGAVGFAIARLIRPGLGGRLAVFGFVLLVIVIGTSFAGGLARAQYGIVSGALTKKYASFAALAWLGFYAVVAGVLFQANKSRRQFVPASMLAAFAVMLSFTLLTLDREEQLWKKSRDTAWEAALVGFVQINDQGELRQMDVNEKEAAEYMEYAKQHNLGVFAYFPFRIGDDASVFFATRTETACRSEVQRVTAMTGQSTRYFDVVGAPAIISGWAWMTDERKPATTVIAVDSTNHIVGAARSTRKSGRAEEWIGQSFDQNLGWYGYARPMVWDGIKFYALTSSGKQFCPMGSLGSVR